MRSFQTSWTPARLDLGVEARRRRLETARASDAPTLQEVREGFGDAIGARGGGSSTARYSYRTGITF